MNLKSFTAGVLVGSIGLTTVFAAPISKAINAVYSINAVTVDGKSIQFTEANKPFTVDGTTFLPVRAVAEALDKNVDYDSATATVKITSKGATGTTPVTPAPAPVQEEVTNLTVDMVSGYEKLEYGCGISSVEKWDTNLKDTAGDYHSTGVFIQTRMNSTLTGQSVDVALLGRYSKFKGQLVLADGAFDFSKTFKGEYTVSILADGREIETLLFKVGTLPQSLDLNVSNVQKLSFKFTETSRGMGNSRGDAEIVFYGLVDVALTK